MDQKFFAQPFSIGGERTVVPDALQPDGNVSFNQGYGADYERDPTTDPAAKAIERTKMNYLFFALTQAIGQYQQFGTPEWITAADNSGVAFPYAIGARVRYRTTPSDPWGVYESRVANNTALPTVAANWTPVSQFVLANNIASQSQAEAGTDNTTIMTPLRVAQAVPAATITTAGRVLLASAADITARTNDTKAVTIAGLIQNLTPSFGNLGLSQLASDPEAIAGVNNLKTITPNSLGTTLVERVFKRKPNVVPFLSASSGTYTVPAGVYVLLVLLWGAGAGGGGGGNPGAGNGGGAGSFGFKFISVTPGQVLNRIVGGGGPGGGTGSGGLSGSNGGASSFGGQISCPGGTGGAGGGTGNGGGGGTPTGADVGWPGNSGTGASVTVGTAQLGPPGGTGFAVGNVSGYAFGTTAGKGPGGGGHGGLGSTAGAQTSGGAGADGALIIVEL